jgi:hypothetical protein
MPSSTLVDATDLDQWADRRDAQDTLPELIRRLVATVPGLIRFSFRSGEGVHLGGWDGIVLAGQGHPFVPVGASGWEMGVNQGVRGKAQDDYNGRRTDPAPLDRAKTAFIFATPRRWPGKERWAAERRADRFWTDVRAYDADDLATWLEQSPAVHVWISGRLGKRPAGAVDLESVWQDWISGTRPRTTTEMVLTGRAEVVDRVRAWSRGDPAPLVLQADSREEALAVFAAAVHTLSDDERVATLAQAVVVRSEAAWEQLTTGLGPLILVLDFETATAIGRAARMGHRVVIPLGREDVAGDEAVIVPPLSRSGAAQAMITAGVSEERAYRLAEGGLLALRRKLAISAATQQPVWSRPEHGPSLVSALLAGAWQDGAEGDREAVAALAGRPYGMYVQDLERWERQSDSPVRRVGDTWYVASREDAWALVGRYITPADIERFHQVVLETLGAIDPQFDLPVEERPMAAIRGQVPRSSGRLRQGLAEALAMLGARGERMVIGSGVSIRDGAARTVRDLLRRANADWRLWASLASVLPLLAEAAPDVFLDAVDRGLIGEEPLLMNLFAETGDVLFVSSPHTGLLWALETVAWSPEHLGYATRLLGVLARRDAVDRPRGGRLLNRPHRSLRAIFLPWLPQTAALLDQRLDALDALRVREPDVAWRLMVELLPKNHDIGHHSARPRWRDWAPEGRPLVVGPDHYRAIAEVANRLLADAGQNGGRWEDVIGALAELPPAQYQACIEALRALDPDRTGAEDRAKIWNALRELVSSHRSFAGRADWAMDEKRVRVLSDIMQRWEPRELTARYGWLFSDAPDLPEGMPRDWRARQDAVTSARDVAIRTIHAHGGVAAVMALVERMPLPFELGAALGRTGFADVNEDDLLSRSLAVHNHADAMFARGFVYGRIGTRGEEWAEAKLAGVGRTWRPAQQAEVLACLPAVPHTWDLAEAAGPDVAECYWRGLPPFGIGGADVERAARSFLVQGNPGAAVALLAMHETVPAAFMAEALEAFANAPGDVGPQRSSFAHDAVELLDRLAQSPDVDEDRVARLEWAFLPLFRLGRQPTILHRALSRDPELFADAVGAVFRAENEEPREISEDQRERTQRGYELLRSWRTIPGSTSTGELDGRVLMDWVARVRALLRARGRAAVGDETIGEMLSGSPAGADGAWPHVGVRDVIEDTASPELERGIEIGVYNGRGTTVRDPFEGGAQERTLTERYEGYARIVADTWPRTAAMLRRIARFYGQDGTAEDQRAALRSALGS